MNISQNRTLAIYTRITCAQIPGLPVHGFLLHNYWNMYAALSPSLHATLRISMVQEKRIVSVRKVWSNRRGVDGLNVGFLRGLYK